MRLANIRNLLFALILASDCACLSSSASALTYTWNKSTGTQTFNNQANWGAGASGFPNAIGDVADMSTLNMTAAQTINVTQSITLGELRVGDTVGTTSGSFGRTFANSGGAGAFVFQTSSGNARLRWGYSDVNNLLRTNTTINVPITLNSNTEFIADLQSSTSRNLYFQNGTLNGSGDFIVDSTTAGIVAIWTNTYTLNNYAGTIKYTSNGASGNMLQLAGTAAGVRNARQATLEMRVATAGGSVWIFDDGNNASLELGALRGDGVVRPFENRPGTLRTGYLPGTNDYSGVLQSASRFNDIAASTAVLNYEKAGANSTQIFSGNNTYTGTTTVTAGTLLVNGTHTGADDYLVNTGGKLGGTGTITPAVGKQLKLLGGTLAPGAGIESLNFVGSASLSSGTFEWEFSGGPPPGSSPPLGADSFNIAGALSIADSAVMLAGVNLGLGVATGFKFVVISYGNTWNNGRFVNELSQVLNDDTFVTVGGKSWFLNYDDTNFSDAKNYSGTEMYGSAVTLTAVPEASSILIMGLGGVFAIGAVWFCKRMSFGFEVKPPPLGIADRRVKQ